MPGAGEGEDNCNLAAIFLDYLVRFNVDMM